MACSTRGVCCMADLYLWVQFELEGGCIEFERYRLCERSPPANAYLQYPGSVHDYSNRHRSNHIRGSLYGRPRREEGVSTRQTRRPIYKTGFLDPWHHVPSDATSWLSPGKYAAEHTVVNATRATTQGIYSRFTSPVEHIARNK